jgi:hypothetical protein
MLAIDCIDNKRARIKIYTRTTGMRFDGILEMMELFSDSLLDGNRDILKGLYRAITGLLVDNSNAERWMKRCIQKRA